MRHKQDQWSNQEESYLCRNYGWLPVWKIAQNLGRTEDAVVVRAKRLGIPSVKDWPYIYTEWQLAPILGHHRKTIWEKMKGGIIPTLTLWKRNTPVMAVDIRELKAWLADPDNWVYLDVEKIVNEELRRVVDRARRQWDDEWLKTGQASEEYHFTTQWFTELIRRGELPAKKYCNWNIKRSDIEAFVSPY